MQCSAVQCDDIAVQCSAVQCDDIAATCRHHSVCSPHQFTPLPQFNVLDAPGISTDLLDTAGISTASGIPDYRSETGLYSANGPNKADMFTDFYNM